MAARIAHPLTRVGRKRSRATWIHREMVTVPPRAGNRTRLTVCPFLFIIVGRNTKDKYFVNEPPCSKLQGIRGKNLMLQKHLALPSSKLQGIVKFKRMVMEVTYKQHNHP